MRNKYIKLKINHLKTIFHTLFIKHHLRAICITTNKKYGAQYALERSTKYHALR